MDMIFIPICLEITEYDLLLKCVDYFSHASIIFDCMQNVEICDVIRNKIMQNLGTKEEFLTYLKNKKKKNNEGEKKV